MPALMNTPPLSFTKEVSSKGYGYHTPQDGSVCHVKVISDEQSVMGELDENGVKEIIIGDVDEPVEQIIEDCVRTMKEEEICFLQFVHPCNFLGVQSSEDKMKTSELTLGENSNSTDVKIAGDESHIIGDIAEESIDSLSQTEVFQEQIEPKEIVKAENLKESNELDVSENYYSIKNMNDFVKVKLQLLSYTREPEIWEMSVTEKWRRASYHKQKGLDLYSRGEYQYAFRRFGLTLKYVISLEHDVPSGQEEGMDIKGLKLSCYLNVGACQMRHRNYEMVVINSSKALKIHPDNAKALYRRGSAYLQLQEYEKAKEDLMAAQALEPKNQAVAKQLQLLKNQVMKLNQFYASAMKKLFC